jgi:hypothetical protein
MLLLVGIAGEPHVGSWSPIQIKTPGTSYKSNPKIYVVNTVNNGLQQLYKLQYFQ